MVNINFKLFLELITIMLFSLTVITNPLKVSACSCDVPDNANEALGQASAVFTGKVLTIKERTIEGEKYNAVLISISEIWKGIKESQVIVYTSWSSCQFDFEEGKEYLLYPYEHNGKLEVINCGRSAEVNAAIKDLTELGEGDDPTIDVQLEDEMDSPFSLKASIVLFLAGILTFIMWRTFRKRT